MCGQDVWRTPLPQAPVAVATDSAPTVHVTQAVVLEDMGDAAVSDDLMASSEDLSSLSANAAAPPAARSAPSLGQPAAPAAPPVVSLFSLSPSIRAPVMNANNAVKCAACRGGHHRHICDKKLRSTHAFRGEAHLRKTGLHSGGKTRKMPKRDQKERVVSEAAKETIAAGIAAGS